MRESQDSFSVPPAATQAIHEALRHIDQAYAAYQRAEAHVRRAKVALEIRQAGLRGAGKSLRQQRTAEHQCRVWEEKIREREWAAAEARRAWELAQQAAMRA